MNWILIALMISTAQAGEFAKKVKDVPEENIFWTQRKAAKKMAGVAAMVQGSEFEIKPKAINKLIKAKKEHVNISVLLSGQKEKLLLVKQTPFTYETDSVHYAGIVKGDDESLVSLSVFDGVVTGSISTNGKKYTISTEGVQVSVLDTSEISAPDAKDTVIEGIKEELKETSEFPSNSSRPVKVFNDVSYRQYLAQGSNKAAITQYMQSVWASVSALFANDGITVQNSGIKVWDTQDPYSSLTETSSSNILYAYRNNRAMEPGSNLMHYTTVVPGMGGIAFLSGLCNANAYAVSSIYTTFQSGSVAYDWTQNVITHEIGHNLSSPHTHACKWTMNGLADQALDGCASPESTSCSRPVNPVGFKGTIMSYCHLSGTMDLRLGFGEQPKNKIKNYIAQSSCLGGAEADANPPIVALTSPTANQTLMGLGSRRFISFTAHADDDVSIAKVEFFLKGPAGNLNNLTFVDYDYPFGVTLGVRDYLGTTSLVGNYTMQAKATDTSGKSTLTPVTPFRIDYAPIDTVKPVATIQTPPEGFNWTSGTMEVAFTATDNVGVTSVQAYGNNQSLGGFSGANFQRTLDYSWFPAGPLRIDMYAFDADGNFGKKTVNITLGGSDVTKPTVQITSPLAAQVVSGSVNITANASDNVGVAKVDFYSDSTLLSTDTTAPYSAVYATTAANNGARVLKAVATDAAGNTGDSTVNVTVSNSVQSFGIASFTVGQNKTVADATKRNWIDLTLTGVVGTPTFQGRAVVNTAWSTKAGADAIVLPDGKRRIFFFNANTDYQVKAMCPSCSPYAEKIQAFKTLP